MNLFEPKDISYDLGHWSRIADRMAASAYAQSHETCSLALPMVGTVISQYPWNKSKVRFTTGRVSKMFTNEQMAFIAVGAAWIGAAVGMVVTCLCSAKKCADCRNYYSRWTEISYQSPPPPKYPPKPPKRGGDDVA